MSILLLSGSAFFSSPTSTSTAAGDEAHGFFHGWTVAALVSDTRHCMRSRVYAVTSMEGVISVGCQQSLSCFLVEKTRYVPLLQGLAVVC